MSPWKFCTGAPSCKVILFPQGCPPPPPPYPPPICEFSPSSEEEKETFEIFQLGSHPAQYWQFRVSIEHTYTQLHMYTDYRGGYWCKQEGKYEYIFKIIYKKRPTFFCCRLICSFPPSPGRWDIQALPATQREERVRERATLRGVRGGECCWRKIRRQQRNSGTS